MKNYYFVFFAMLPLTASAFPFEVEKQLNGAEVSTTTQEIDHNMGAILLYNYGRADAECTAVFRNGPEAPRTRKAKVAAGQSESMTYKSSRSIIRLRAELTCALQ